MLLFMFSADPKAAKGVEACGADDYISKPFEMNELLTKIKKHIS